MDLVRAIEDTPVKAGDSRPQQDVVIEECGQLGQGEPDVSPNADVSAAPASDVSDKTQEGEEEGLPDLVQASLAAEAGQA